MAIKVSRRQLLQATTGLAVGLGIGSPKLTFAQGCVAQEGTVRDRLWLFAAPTNANINYVGRRSLMTPVEGAYYLSIPNIMIIQFGGEIAQYGRFDPPFDQYAIGMRPLKRVLWSVVGGGGATIAEERKEVLALAKRTPNFVGVYMDDFFTGKKEGKLAVLTLDELREIRDQAKGPGKKLDIWITFYTSQLDLPVGDYLKMIDVLTLWTWKPAELVNLEANLSRVPPGVRKTLGCYFFHYGEKKPLSVPDMKRQCEQGLEWLRQGRIEGMVFLANTVMDLGFECVEWTREWIQKVGDTRL